MFLSSKSIVFFSIVILFFSSCKKEQPEITNPLAGCDCANEVSADFVMEEMSSFDGNLILFTDTDTIYANKNVRFRALENNATYEWQIGAEQLNTQEFKRYFDNSHIGEVIPVQLIVHKKPNTICFPNDDGIDTVVKYLIIGPVFNDDFYTLPNPRFDGIYRMKLNNQPDSIDLYVDARFFYPPANIDVMVFGNYDGEGDTIIALGFFGQRNYRQFRLETNLQGYNFPSYWHQRLDGVYELNLIKNNDPSKNLRYLGRKLN